MRPIQCLGVLPGPIYQAPQSLTSRLQRRTTIRRLADLLGATTCRHVNCTSYELMPSLMSTGRTIVKTGLVSRINRIAQLFHRTSGGLRIAKNPITATLRVSDQGTTIPCAIARLIRILACLLETPAGTCHLNMMALSLVLGIMRQSQAIT